MKDKIKINQIPFGKYCYKQYKGFKMGCPFYSPRTYALGLCMFLDRKEIHNRVKICNYNMEEK